jgi:hypothetical protein
MPVSAWTFPSSMDCSHPEGDCVQTIPGRSPGFRIRAPGPPFPPALPKWTTDGGYEVDYRLQWRDRPGFSPGSLFSLSGTWNVYNLLFRNPLYPHSLGFVKLLCLPGADFSRQTWLLDQTETAWAKPRRKAAGYGQGGLQAIRCAFLNSSCNARRFLLFSLIF